MFILHNIRNTKVNKNLCGSLEHKGQAAFSASLTVKMSGHKDAGTAGLSGTLAAKSVDLAVVIDLVVLEGSELDLLVLMLALLGGGVVLLLALLTTT
jgi:hypothetical protein